jgi:hypothetical protein
MQKRVGSNIFTMLLIVLACLGLVVYLTIVFNTGDPFFFLGGAFTEKPAIVAVYQDGKKTEYRAGMPGYDDLAEGVRKSLDSGISRPSNIGLSDESRQDFFSEYTSVEAIFLTPVRLHTYFYTGNPNRVLFPITGRHTELPVVFLSEKNEPYTTLSPVLNTRAPLVDALAKLGYRTQ